MLPLIELRNYTSYVIGYLKDLFSQKTASKTLLTGEQFINTFDALHSSKYNIPNASKQELTAISSLLQVKLFCGIAVYFLYLLKIATKERD